MEHILDKGLAFYWGTSRWSPVHIMEAFTVARQFNLTPPTVEQMEYHMFTRDKMEVMILFKRIEFSKCSNHKPSPAIYARIVS